MTQKFKNFSGICKPESKIFSPKLELDFLRDQSRIPTHCSKVSTEKKETSKALKVLNEGKEALKASTERKKTAKVLTVEIEALKVLIKGRNLEKAFKVLTEEKEALKVLTDEKDVLNVLMKKKEALVLKVLIEGKKRSSMNFENRWVLRSALNFASDGEIVREVASAREQDMEIYEKRKGHEQLYEQQS
ncbi:hypothetical protein HELRODRAFT_176030 [Helobdella robusta]|uniref:Uncharacterized protein n=1 Tax=Helobdella robusta TaxID=6412 RepID=T1FA20_HELRO|nr:hypothetical protein HELRODRAFT_176030 [Helobdella robusta]ESO00196.1 hypothetical protein HELRODRAFT_176030 [Helobdella robusta]